MPLRKIVNKLLGEILIERRIITPEQFQKALSIKEEQGGLIGEILVEMGFAKEEDIAQALTAQYGFPYLPLDSYEIDSEVVEMVPCEIAKQYLCMPVDRLSKSLSVAMSNPLDNEAIEKLEKLTGCKVQIFVSTSGDIRRAIEKYYHK